MDEEAFTPVVLAIGGSDSSAGAGIQADLKTIHAHGAYAATVITAITSQDTQGVRSSFPTPAAVLGDQLRTVLADMHIGSVKLGMVPHLEAAQVIADALIDQPGLPLVVDPVMGSTSGFSLAEPSMVSELCELLAPSASLITPNIPEAEFLLGRGIQSPDEAVEAAAALRDLWGCAVLLKGGHLPDGENPVDFLADEEGEESLVGFRLEVSHSHGTGCCLSSAVASQLALGAALRFAVREAKDFVARALLFPVITGDHPSAFDPFCGRLSNEEHSGFS